jgi:hypothetical protein
MKPKVIKWRDSTMHLTQESKDTDWSVCVIESVGFVIHEDKEKIVLAGDLVDDDVRRVIVIPKENII